MSANSVTHPIDMVLHCPACGVQHIDEPDERTPDWKNPPHRSHLCHGCEHIWRPADIATNGVRAIVTQGKNDSPRPCRTLFEAGRIAELRKLSCDALVRGVRGVSLATIDERFAELSGAPQTRT